MWGSYSFTDLDIKLGHACTPLSANKIAEMKRRNRQRTSISDERWFRGHCSSLFHEVGGLSRILARGPDMRIGSHREYSVNLPRYPIPVRARGTAAVMITMVSPPRAVHRHSYP